MSERYEVDGAARALWETLLTHYATLYTLDQIETWVELRGP